MEGEGEVGRERGEEADGKREEGRMERGGRKGGSIYGDRREEGGGALIAQRAATAAESACTQTRLQLPSSEDSLVLHGRQQTPLQPWRA